MKVTVAKALKIKNRLTALIKEKGEGVRENNSIVKDGIRKVDVRKEIEDRDRAVDVLVKVKTALYNSNMGIQDKVYRLAELKSMLAFWDDVPCDEGLCRPRHSRRSDMFDYRSKEFHEMTTILSFDDIRALKKQLTSEADEIQDELDRHNHLTKVEVPDEYMELLGN